MHKGILPVSVRNAGWRGKSFLDTCYTTRVAGGNLLSAQHLTHGFHDLAVFGGVRGTHAWEGADHTTLLPIQRGRDKLTHIGDTFLRRFRQIMHLFPELLFAPLPGVSGLLRTILHRSDRPTMPTTVTMVSMITTMAATAHITCTASSGIMAVSRSTCGWTTSMINTPPNPNTIAPSRQMRPWMLNR